MALTLYPNDGANSFITVAEADDYIAWSPLKSHWEALANEDKEIYLAVAYDRIDALPITLPSTISDCIKKSQALTALQDVVFGISTDTSKDGDIQSATVGTVSVVYRNSKPINVFPDFAVTCLNKYGAGIGSFGSIRLARG